MPEDEIPAESIDAPLAEPATDPAPEPAAQPVPPTTRDRWFQRRALWVIAALAVVVLALGAGAAALVEFDGGHRDHRAEGDSADCSRTDSGKDSGEGRESDDDKAASCSNGVTSASTAGGSGVVPVTGTPNGPVVIEPATPGGNRTVVWPDGRVVTIPSGSGTATDVTTSTTTTTP